MAAFAMRLDSTVPFGNVRGEKQLGHGSCPQPSFVPCCIGHVRNLGGALSLCRWSEERSRTLSVCAQAQRRHERTHSSEGPSHESATSETIVMTTDSTIRLR